METDDLLVHRVLAGDKPAFGALVDRHLRIGDMRVEQVAVTGCRENVFDSSLWIRASGAVHEVDARPSDALATALECDAPILVTEAEGKPEPDQVERERRSVRSLPRNEAQWLRPRGAR